MLAGHVGVLHVLLDHLRQVVAHRELVHANKGCGECGGVPRGGWRVIWG